MMDQPEADPADALALKLAFQPTSEAVTSGLISFERHVELCRYFQFDQLKRVVNEAPNDLERDVMLTSTFFILDREVKADYLDTLKWGEYYLGYFSDHPDLSAEISKPRNDILRRMAIIYEKCDMLDRALGICDFADFYDIHSDGTRGGFICRRKRLAAKLKARSEEKVKSPNQPLPPPAGHRDESL
jgi:hypothetical protein